MDLSGFEANLVYKERSRTAKTVIQRNPISKNQKEKQTNKQTKNALQATLQPDLMEASSQLRLPPFR